MTRGRAVPKRETGHLMVGVMAGIAVMMILSTVAVQEWQQVLRRDNEAEMMFRAQEIVRALRRYQKDRGALPTELKQLMEPGSKSQYFLRRLYKDPLVKGGAWGLLYASPQGGLVDPTAPAAPESPGGLPGSPGPTTAGGLKISSIGSASQPGSAPNPGGAFGQIGDAGNVAGLPIAGVKSLSKDTPFRVYQDQTDYAHWLFSIFDVEGQQQGGAPGEGEPGAVPGTPPPAGGTRMPAPTPPPPPPAPGS
jgi:type II secretory pathway pseudopilin PulG